MSDHALPLPLLLPTSGFLAFLNQTAPGVLSGLPANYTVNITDPELLKTCGVDNPGRCKTTFSATGVTVTASLAVLVASLLSALTVH